MPENPKPLQVPKVPVLPNGQKNIKMTRMINLMRYPEKVHNKLIHKQYGVVVSYIEYKFTYFVDADLL